MTDEERRLHAFTLRLAERLFLAAECLGRAAEKKRVKGNRMKNANPNILGTKDIAQRCGVAARTACRWIDDGILKGWRVPGSLHRRVLETDLVAFMKEHGIPDLREAAVAERAKEGAA